MYNLYFKTFSLIKAHAPIVWKILVVQINLYISDIDLTLVIQVTILLHFKK